MEKTKRDKVALVGAGKGGTAILQALLKNPATEIKYVCDIDQNAPGILLAKKYGIECLVGDGPLKQIYSSAIDIIFEVTGSKKLFKEIDTNKSSNTACIGAAGTEVIFHFLDAQEKVNKRLENHKKRLEFNILKGVEDVEKANRELEQKIVEHEALNDKLQVINDEKTRYLLQATHHLKAPFAAIQSYTDIILEGYTGDIPDHTRGIMEKIKIRCELLSNGIKEMLELANLKSCVKDNIKLENIALNDFFPTVTAPFHAVETNRNLKINFFNTEEDYYVRCNRKQLFILFNILLENAVNYSHDDSQIDLVLTMCGHQKLCVSVKDYGIGIPAENIDNIFKEYFRSNNAVKQYENGTGLGLSIVKEIVNLFNFNLEIDSTINQGTTITITMPVSQELEVRDKENFC